jgi:hypothetical protein
VAGSSGGARAPFEVLERNWRRVASTHTLQVGAAGGRQAGSHLQWRRSANSSPLAIARVSILRSLHAAGLDGSRCACKASPGGRSQAPGPWVRRTVPPMLLPRPLPAANKPHTLLLHGPGRPYKLKPACGMPLQAAFDRWRSRQPRPGYLCHRGEPLPRLHRSRSLFTRCARRPCAPAPPAASQAFAVAAAAQA